MKTWLGALLCLGLLVRPGFCCLGGGAGGGGVSTTTQATTAAGGGGGGGGGGGADDSGAALDKLGGVDSTEAPDSGAFDGAQGGPVSSPDQLNCDFEKSETCCWTNDSPPKDELQWIVGSGFKDPAKFQGFMGAAPPTSKALLVAAGPTDASKKANYRSCSVKCSGPVKVNVKHWSSSSVALEVCQTAAGADNSPLINCKTLDRAQSSGPTEVELPPMDNMSLVITARNFADAGAAAVDDITVSYDTAGCPGEKGADGGACEAVACDFAFDACKYQNVPPGAGAKASEIPWDFHNEPTFRNAHTGIKSVPPNGQGYYATYVKGGEESLAESGEFDLPEPKVLSWDYWDATAAAKLSLCLDSPTDCPWESGDISATDRSWKQNRYLLPSGTKKVYWKAQNTGNNQGAIGVANIKLLNPDPSGDVEAASEDACAA